MYRIFYEKIETLLMVKLYLFRCSQSFNRFHFFCYLVSFLQGLPFYCYSTKIFNKSIRFCCGTEDRETDWLQKHQRKEEDKSHLFCALWLFHLLQENEWQSLKHALSSVMGLNLAWNRLIFWESSTTQILRTAYPAKFSNITNKIQFPAKFSANNWSAVELLSGCSPAQSLLSVPRP